MDRQVLHALCYVISAAAMIGAGAYLIFGANKGLGVLAVLGAVILCRMLILNIVHGKS